MGEAGGPSDAASYAACLLAHLPRMPHLRRLRLAGHGLEPPELTLGMLRYASSLEELDLSDCFCESVSGFNEAVTAAAGLSCLTRLNLAGTAITGAALSSICASLTNLEELDLSRTDFSDADAEVLRPLRSLRGLHLDQQRICSVGEATLAVLASLPYLARLSLNGNCELSASSLNSLGRFPRLSTLHLSGARNIDVPRALWSLQGCQQLGEVVLGEPRGLMRDGICLAPSLLHQAHLDDFFNRHHLLRKLELGPQVIVSQSKQGYLLGWLAIVMEVLGLDLSLPIARLRLACSSLLTRLLPGLPPRPFEGPIRRVARDGTA
eukprot:jgi/Botrbrau1/10082/Bobra.0355s0035.1